MSPEVQQALISLLGAVALAVPLTARAIPGAIDRWSKAKADLKKAEADAVVKHAEAERLEAEAAKSALDDFRKRLDDCEKKHADQLQRIEHLQRQSASDNELLERFAAQLEQNKIDLEQGRVERVRDEGVMRGMRMEIDELRSIIQTGDVR